MIDGKLASILRLLDSPSEGEAVNALSAARRFMARSGVSFGDLTRAAEAHAEQTRKATHAAGSSDSAWADVARRAAEEILRREEEERRRRAAEEQRRHEEEEREEAEAAAIYAQKRARQRRSIVRKYGSMARATAPTHHEALVDVAAAPYLLKDQNGKLSGWSGEPEPLPAPVAEVIRNALPWPRTLAEAAVELKFWEERDDELGCLFGLEECESALSAACSARNALIEDALAFDMHSSSVHDLAHRLRFGVKRNWADTRIAEAVLRDLERLASTGGAHPGWHNMAGERASSRRATVLVMLADPNLARLRDREIARRAGVSPSTVGNIRRQLAQQKQGDLFGAAT